MSNITVVMDGGGKYRVDMKKVVEAKGEYVVLRISAIDGGGNITLVFNTFDQATGFMAAVTQAMLAEASKVSST